MPNLLGKGRPEFFLHRTSCFSFLAGLALCILGSNSAHAATLAVPENYDSIQQAIDAAQDGDVISVGPGTYTQNLNFNGKRLTLSSTDGAESTRIETPGGTAIFAGPVATITGFHLSGGKTAPGGAIQLVGHENRVSHNIFSENTLGYLYQGVAIGGSADVDIDNNIFRDNTCNGSSSTGVIDIINRATVRVRNNIFYNNLCYAIEPSITDRGNGLIVNNTIANNLVGLYLNRTAYADNLVFRNNIVIDNQTGIEVDLDTGPHGLLFENNIFFNNNTDFLGFPDLIGVLGNVSVEPEFTDYATNDFHLSAGSPAIDGGLLIGAPRFDMDDSIRPVDADRDGVALPDIGADEFDNGTISPTSFLARGQFVATTNSHEDYYFGLEPLLLLEKSTALVTKVGNTGVIAPLTFTSDIRPGGSRVWMGDYWSNRLYLIDPDSGDISLVADITGMEDDILTLAFDSVSQTLYGLDYDGRFYRIDHLTGVATLVHWRAFAGMTNISFDDKGELYGLHNAGHSFWRLDLETLEKEFIARAQVDNCCSGFGAMAFDADEEKMYYIANTRDKVLTIDRITGEKVIIGEYSAWIDGIQGMAYVPLAILADTRFVSDAAEKKIAVKSNGLLKVAILDTPELKTDDIDPATLVFGFGAAGATKHYFEDVNGDEKPDLVAGFRISDSSFICGDDTATIYGYTYDRRRFEDRLSISATGC